MFVKPFFHDQKIKKQNQWFSYCRLHKKVKWITNKKFKVLIDMLKTLFDET